MVDENVINIPDYLSEDAVADTTNESELVYVPSFLSGSEDEYDIALTATNCTSGQYCGTVMEDISCCETYNSMYCGTVQACGQTCSESCNESCSESCGESSSSETLTEGSIISLTSTKDSITIVFSPIQGATHYWVYYRPTATTTAKTIKDVKSTSCTISGLQSGTDYVVNYRGATPSMLGPLLTTDELSRTIATKRGNEWSWWNPVGSGLPVLLEANEWNDFCTFINGVRDDNGLSAYNFTTVYSGYPIKAAYVSQAITAISAISGHGGLPAVVTPGDAITAQFFIDLADAINAAL